MIGRLQGRIASDQPDGAMILDVHGVGYELLCAPGAFCRAGIAPDGDVVVHVHTLSRQDTLELFGFPSELERKVFRLLIAVPNVGPRTALAVLASLTPAELRVSVQERDVTRLCRVPGIGKKTAERLVLELQNKLSEVVLAKDQAAAAPPKPSGERLVRALVNLGYRSSDAQRAVDSLGDLVGSRAEAELIREALAFLLR